MIYLRQIPFIIKISALFILLLMLFSATTADSVDVILAWERPNDIRVTGYKIFYGPKGSNFKSIAKEIITSADQTTCNIYELKDGNTYGFAAKSFDKNGDESDFSEVIFYNVLEAQNLKSIDGNNNEVDGSNDFEDNKDKGEGGGGGGCFIQHISNLNIWD